MRLKNNTVIITNLHQSFWQPLFLVDNLWRGFIGYELVITSANDGEHLDDSKHYDDLAIDMRTWINSYHGEQLEGRKRQQARREVQSIMGADFLVLDELDHFHLQRQN